MSVQARKGGSAEAMSSYVKRHVRKSQQERRQEITEATLTILGEYGLEGATVSRIAEAAGLTPGALYRHFASRDEMFSAAHQAGGSDAMTWLATSDEVDVVQRLEALADTHAAWTRDHLTRVVRPFFQALAAFSQHTNLADQMSLPRIETYQAFVDLAEEGKRQGGIRADVDSADVAWAMLMFAWTQDIALMLGAEDMIESGIFSRNLKRMISAFAADDAES
jgi:AcrR family transcriptional regulator